MNLQSIVQTWGPYALALCLYMLLTTLLHGLASFFGGPNFAANWPRLTRFFVASRINPVEMLNAAADGVPKPPAPPGAAAAMASSLLIACLAFGAGMMVLASSVTACQTLPTSQEITSAIDAGCTAIGILDPNGQSAASICEDAAPIAGPIIANIVSRIEKREGEQVPPHYVAVTLHGKAIGLVRVDIAGEVQAELDTQ